MMTGEGVNKSGDRLIFVASLLVFLLLLAFPAAVADGVRSGLSLSYRAVIPAVFPSIVLTSLLFSRSGGLIERTVGRVFSRLFRVSPRGAVAYVAGLLAGFPVGAVTVANDVKTGRLTKSEGEYLLSFVNNTGPAFLVGGIGVGTFGSARVGWSLYLLQIAVSLAVGLLFRPRRSFPITCRENPGTGGIDPVTAIVSASGTSVGIVGFVCFFSALSSLISRFLPFGLPLAAASALLEVGTGAARAASLASPFPAYPLVAFAVCFSGLSVHFQTISAVKDAGIVAKKYLRAKMTAGVLSFVLASIICLTK